LAEPNVTVVLATVTALVEKDGKVIGVEYRPNSKDGQVRGIDDSHHKWIIAIVVACDKWQSAFSHRCNNSKRRRRSRLTLL